MKGIIDTYLTTSSSLQIAADTGTHCYTWQILCLPCHLLSLQDIDVAYATDPAIFEDFEADLSSLLEVPDLAFPSSHDFPSASYRDSAFASSSAAGKQAFQPVI